MFIKGYEDVARKVKKAVSEGLASEVSSKAGVTSTYIREVAKGNRLKASAASLQKISDAVDSVEKAHRND